LDVHPILEENLTSEMSKAERAPKISKAEAEGAEFGLKLLYDGDSAEVE
jgi:hypothetical protein